MLELIIWLFIKCRYTIKHCFASLYLFSSVLLTKKFDKDFSSISDENLKLSGNIWIVLSILCDSFFINYIKNIMYVTYLSWLILFFINNNLVIPFNDICSIGDMLPFKTCSQKGYVYLSHLLLIYLLSLNGTLIWWIYVHSV